MPMILKIRNKAVRLELLNNKTSQILSSLTSFKSNINTWGDEIYFKTPTKNIILDSNTSDIMNYGEVAYWIEGNSIAIGFGPTPASINDEIRLVSKVNIWAKFDTKQLSIDFLRSLSYNEIIEVIN